MGGEVEHLFLALAASIEIHIGDDDLITQRLGFRHHAAIRVHNHRTANQAGTILNARLGDRNRPGRVHIGIALHGECRMEGAQGLIFAIAAHRIIGGRVIANQHQFDPLQAIAAPGFRPAAVIADQHAKHGPAPGFGAAKGGEAKITILEIALFQLLEAITHTRFHRAGQVNLAILAEHAAIRPNRDRRIVALAMRREFRIAKIEPNAQRARAIKQGLHARIGHLAFKIAVQFGLLGEQPAREKGGQWQFRKHHHLGAGGSGLLQQYDHARQNRLAAIGFLVGAHLGAGKAQYAGHCSSSGRIASTTGR